MSASMAVLYGVARLEVLFRAGLLKKPTPSAPDELPASCVPSVQLGDARDRTLAEIDQWGYCFALDSRDQELFHTREIKEPRRHSELLIVLSRGRVCLRKHMLPERGGNLGARIRNWLGWAFYLEAAALLRLRGVDGVPALRRIDTRTRTIEMDYVRGRDIRHEIIGSTGARSCDEIDRIFRARLRAEERLGQETRQLMNRVMMRGVLPGDVHAANFIRGDKTGCLYLVDYHLVHFRPVPRWRARRRELAQWLDGSTQAARV